jgi:hypothetical protein
MLPANMSRVGTAQPEKSTPMSKWLVLPTIVLVYIATSATAAAPRDRDHDRLPDRWERNHQLSTAIPSAKRDPDSDRLSNRRELRLRTHPRRADSDRDRLRDRAEVRRFHTNPRRRDTDGDGFRDRCELRSGTNPRNRRSRPIRRCSDSPPRHVTPTPAPASAGGGGSDGFPNASKTGVPAATNLTAYMGPNPVTVDGTVIDGRHFTDCSTLVVEAEDVVIRNSLFECADGGVYYEDDGVPGGGPLIEDSEIECTGPEGGTGVGEADFTLRRVEISSCENGADMNRDILIEDSWIHSLENGGVDPHEDGVQVAVGHFENGDTGTVVLGGENITLRHNTISGANKDGSQGTSAIITTANNPGDPGLDVNILIEDNLLMNGTTTLYCNRPGAGTNFQVLDNRFDPAKGFGVEDDCGDETYSGNVYHDTGEPVTFHDV